MDILTTPVSASARDHVYRVLHDRIMHIEYSPDTCISAAEIAKELHVSRTPIQNAFTRLAAEGLVTVFPQRGTYVSKIDLQKVYESAMMRILLDQVSIRVFCSMDNAQMLTELESNVSQQFFYLEKKEYQKLFELDQAFHNSIYRLTNFGYTQQALDTISMDQIRFRQLKLNTQIRQKETVLEHLEIFHALKMRDADKATYLDAMHITYFGTDIDTIYEKNPAFFTNWSKDLAERFQVQRQNMYILRKHI